MQIILGLVLWYVILQSGIEASISGVLFAFAIPVHKLVAVEKAIHNIVNFLILPLFALANTSILLPSNPSAALTSTLALGIMAGLVIGKPLGIFFMSYILVSLNMAALPTNIKWKQILGMGTLAGIGFTMSIFTTMLAFGGEENRDIAKIAILVSVTLSAVCSILYFSGKIAEPFKQPVKIKQLDFKPA
jgi:NhaA family Na+:H+ antiporter